MTGLETPPTARLTIVIGGNGAGKTTWCRRHRDLLPEHFYNADSIAEGLGGWNIPAKQRAARELIDRAIEAHLEKLDDFGFESTYSGRSRPRIVERAKALGYETTAIFVGTRQPEINVDRIAMRVAGLSGHDVETREVHRRWTAAQENLVRTAQAMRRIALMDNSDESARCTMEIEHGLAANPTSPVPDWVTRLTQRILRHSGARRTGGKPALQPSGDSQRDS